MAVRPLKVHCYIEDRAHENFIRAVVQRIYNEVSHKNRNIEFDFSSPYLKFSVPEEEIPSKDYSIREVAILKKRYKEFIKYLDNPDITGKWDIVIIVIDGNCDANKKEKDFKSKIQNNNPYKDKMVFCIPNPHIEKWYIMDNHAFNRGVGIQVDINIPLEKCKKGFYKSLMRDSLLKAGIPSLAGGVEYAEDIVNSINKLYDFAKLNSGFNRFLKNLSVALKEQ